LENKTVQLKSVLHEMMLDSDRLDEDVIVGQLYTNKACSIVDAFRLGQQYALDRVEEMLKHNKLDTLEIEYNL
jgi:hypothetical protein